MSSTQNIYQGPDGNEVTFINGDTAVVFERGCKPCTEVKPSADPYANSYYQGLNGMSVSKRVMRWQPLWEPQSLVNAIMCDKDAPALLMSKRRNLMGKMVWPVCYGCGPSGNELITRYVDFPKWERWKKKNKWWFNRFMLERGTNFVFFRNAFTLIRLDQGDNRTAEFGSVKELENIDATDILACEMEEGTNRIKHYVVISKRANNVKYMVLPAFDWRNPRKYPVSIHHSKDHIPGNPYYAYQLHVGALKSLKLRRDWEDFHLSGFANGWNIKYVITIPTEIIEKVLKHKLSEAKASGSKPTFDSVKKGIVKDLENELAGTDKNQSTVITMSFLGERGDEIKLDVKPLDQKFKGEEYLQMAKFIDQNLSLAFDSPNVLNGKSVENNFGGGSQIFRQQNLENTTRNYQDRSIVLEIMRVLACVNNWDSSVDFDLDWEFYSPNLTTLDLHKTGEAPPGIQTTVTA